MPEELIRDILLSWVAAGLAAACGAWLARGGYWASAGAVGAAYFLGHGIAQRGVPPMPPPDSVHWLAWLALAAGACAPALAVGSPRSWAAGWVARVAALVLAVWLAGKFYALGGPPWHEAAAWVVVFGGGGALFWWSADRVAEGRPAWVSALVLGVVLGGSALVFGVARDPRMGQMAGVLAATAGGMCAAGWIAGRGPDASRGAACVAAVVWTGMAVYSARFSGLPWAAGCLLLAGCAAPGLAVATFARGWSPVGSGAAAAGSAVALIGLAAGYTVWVLPPPMDY